MPGSLPMFSIMSISPHVGHFTEPMLLPSIQKAGQIPCPAGIFDARLKSSVRLAEESLRLQARRGVIARHSVGARVGFLLRSDDKIAVLELHVLRAIGVVLELVVAPAVAADVVGPLRRIRR